LFIFDKDGKQKKRSKLVTLEKRIPNEFIYLSVEKELGWYIRQAI
jgi:hypothetical protein